jgi:hypothetical protein
VRSRFQIVLQVRLQDPTKATFVRDDDVIETLATNGPDQPLRIGILPGRMPSRHHFIDADRRRRPCRERGIAIADQIARGVVPRKRFTELLAVDAAVRRSVTATCTMRRRSWASITNSNSSRQVAVGTTKKSAAAIWWT